MLDLLNYYYYIITDKTSLKDGNYYFNYQNKHFCLYQYNGSISNINDLFNLNVYMINNNLKINRIILNNKKEVLTMYDNRYYCLIALDNYSNNLISLKQVLEFNQSLVNLNILKRSNWLELWSYKIDNIEYSINHLIHKYKIIYNSIYYYIGLTENAISYLKMLNINNKNLSINHNRVTCNMTITEFYNPLNLVIDYRIRDLSEYLKSCFFNSKMDIFEIINYLKRINMFDYDYIYFYVRMLFPSYYFDYYDLILLGKKKEEDIYKIIKMQGDYEYLLHEIYLYLKTKVNIIGIDWINRNVG